DEILGLLESYDWPGNIRELRNVIERAVALCPGQEIRADDFPEAIRHCGAPPAAAPARIELSWSGATLAQTKEEAELARIAKALEKHGNNRLRAAAELGISR